MANFCCSCQSLAARALRTVLVPGFGDVVVMAAAVRITDWCRQAVLELPVPDCNQKPVNEAPFLSVPTHLNKSLPCLYVYLSQALSQAQPCPRSMGAW
jgi:hypothetical protein